MDQVNTNQPTSTVPPQATDKKKRSVKKIIRKGLFYFFLLLVGVGAFFFVKNQIALRGIPQESTFYAATHEGMPMLFFRNKDMLISGIASDPHLGDFIEYDKTYKMTHHEIKPMDFRMLKNVRKLFTYEHYASVHNLKLSTDKEYLFFSFIGGEMDNTNYIYQVNLKTTESKKLWEHELGNGFAQILDVAPDQYLAFALIKGENPPTSVVVKNLQSGQEKELGVVGDVKINLANKTVAYKKIGKVKAACEEKDPVCFATDTYKMVDKPTGETLSQPLP